MTAMAFIGMIVVGVALAIGIYWLMTNITFRQTSTRYIYVTDSDGVETVVDTAEK